MTRRQATTRRMTRRSEAPAKASLRAGALSPLLVHWGCARVPALCVGSVRAGLLPGPQPLSRVHAAQGS